MHFFIFFVILASDVCVFLPLLGCNDSFSLCFDLMFHGTSSVKLFEVIV